MKNQVKVAVIQDSSIPFDAGGTAAKACTLLQQAAESGAELVVFPEAFLGTYPKGLTFDAPIGTRLPEGRRDYQRYFEGAVDLDGPELEQVRQCANEHGTFVVLGIIERYGATLYCTVVFIDPAKGIVGKRRKLMPTGAERLVWGFGDGSTLDVVKSDLGNIGAVICWENYMPALRMATYGQGVEIYCAPTADDRDTWLPTLQHIAMEGRCYVLSACQTITRGEFAEDYRCVLGDNPEQHLMRGGSAIVGPLGEIIAGPLFGERGILYAELDAATLIRSKLDFDPVGHYSRPDVFSLKVDTEEKKPVDFGSSV
ncbi:carbon-nitrogen hydrolase family protein [Phaeobacter gallaeciensis]|uniref:carbon-nitrogen hydrolase family protein n=1 Tax=Phaeobacter gallaeciensis TaxID=60890 RepID=UPI00237F6BEE|nr:carbon-nitrogen hydrolase family protein [Phaeobacter gallaeciensis]MDE4305834.1 carbon-nitrogen hydrolase family protein [Phaeobacter gallaeciensis]MDE4310185.1 carbon-nitrogen hydrolase family protein [Phaeobacter gallaeciensis]MDE4314697.1 carbon-nitrogen hydrolase family protein [Phaeobacter gallaeciensis]MDE4319088.1 carbon-nitrogen hydrolase family protein [Phaeobacter gallaeciensis]MDE4323584.1 carbon-nitrogen hydrolase family protein [Phaeobacter gallaeciensis]